MAKLAGPMEVVYPAAYWRNITPRILGQPNVPNWFQAVDTQNVPERQLGWLLAKGYQVVAVADDPNNPPHKLYRVQKFELKNHQVLSDLIAEYTRAFNEGRQANDMRYDDLVVMYNDALLKTHSHLNRAAAANNATKTLFLTSLDSIIGASDNWLEKIRVGAAETFEHAHQALNLSAATFAQLGTGYDEYKAQLATILSSQQSTLDQFTARTGAVLTQLLGDYDTLSGEIDALDGLAETTAEAHIVAFEAKLDEMATRVDSVEEQLLAITAEAQQAYLAYRTEGLGVITAIHGELATLRGEIGTQLNRLDGAVDSHTVTYQTLLAQFQSDWSAHAATTRGLLVGLGATEEARIEERFDNLTARTRQAMVDRGFYSSALVAQLEARIERERSEALGDLADRLAREKLVNEHQLYGQQAGMRDRQAQGEQYLHGLAAAAIDYRAQWSERLYQQVVALQQFTLSTHDSFRAAKGQFLAQDAAVRERVFSWRQEATRALAESKDRIYQIREALSRRKADSTWRLGDVLRQVRSLRLGLAERDLASSLDVSRFAATARESILDKLNGYIATYAGAVAQYSQQTVANGQFLFGLQERTAAEQLRTRYEFCRGLTESNFYQQQLYRWQLDTRNNLAVGLFGFMERREDEYPDLSKMGEIAIGLGDAGVVHKME